MDYLNTKFYFNGINTEIEIKFGFNLSFIFARCKSLKSLPDISEWNTSLTLSMKGLFYGCSSLKILPDIIYMLIFFLFICFYYYFLSFYIFIKRIIICFSNTIFN